MTGNLPVSVIFPEEAEGQITDLDGHYFVLLADVRGELSQVAYGVRPWTPVNGCAVITRSR